jgi:uncharacterized membrane protein YcgQ (UPF0703/DUF1980 family)
LQETYLASKDECEQFRSFEYDNSGQYRTVITREKKAKKKRKDKDKMNIQVNGSNVMEPMSFAPTNNGTFIGQIPQSA